MKTYIDGLKAAGGPDRWSISSITRFGLNLYRPNGDGAFFVNWGELDEKYFIEGE